MLSYYLDYYPGYRQRALRLLRQGEDERRFPRLLQETGRQEELQVQHVYMHFRTFTQGKCTFGEINVDLCNKFREYLLTAPQGLHKNRKLHINSAANYWSTFRASIHTAYRDRKIKENPNGFLERIETIPTDKEHLSQDEVIRLASTESRDTVQFILPT